MPDARVSGPEPKKPLLFFVYVVSLCPGADSLEGKAKDYRRLAAESRRLAATATDAGSLAQYEALAEMWRALAEEAERDEKGSGEVRGNS